MVVAAAQIFYRKLIYSRTSGTVGVCPTPREIFRSY